MAFETIDEIIRDAASKRASDIHITPGSPIMYRIDGAMIPVSEERIGPEQSQKYMFDIMDDEKIESLKKNGEVDFAYMLKGVSRIRVNSFYQRGSVATALRILAVDIPDAKTLGIPKAVVETTNLKRGLVLVTGATGSGKSTTLASLINIISKNYAKNIITLEDPIEYLHAHNKSMVAQREIGWDSRSYANALRAALRQDPDVILVGEMRDLETIQTAISAAETGHLVYSTLHTNSASDAIDRMIDVFPPHQQQQIRIQLASVLECVVAQQLMPKSTGTGRQACFEVLLGTPAVRNLIREGKAFQLPNQMQTNKKIGMQLMDDELRNAYLKHEITYETAINYAFDPGMMEQRLNNI